MQTPAIGDLVFFEGFAHRIMEFRDATVRFVSEMIAETANGSRPRFEHIVLTSDLRWSDELGSWYLWGRVLCKGRGGVGEDQRRIVAELRDRGIVPSRKGRRSGSVPAGGEHVNLCCTLFRRGIDWSKEFHNLKNGGRLSSLAQESVNSYCDRYKEKLHEGYAFPDADDSWSE